LHDAEKCIKTCKQIIANESEQIFGSVFRVATFMRKPGKVRGNKKIIREVRY
jgi:hypothetical protein